MCVHKGKHTGGPAVWVPCLLSAESKGWCQFPISILQSFCEKEGERERERARESERERERGRHTEAHISDSQFMSEIDTYRYPNS